MRETGRESERARERRETREKDGPAADERASLAIAVHGMRADRDRIARTAGPVTVMATPLHAKLRCAEKRHLRS